MQSVIKTKSKKTIAIKRKPPLATLKQETKKNILRVVSKNDYFLGKYRLFNKIYTARYQVM